ncbi:MAG TPA: hypothetical protein PKC67_02580 [Kiritimatiellia bacterium]|nr:hypothetical protein [Kiritimatiellia bacterium]HMP33212.1 hypothetical protein [Kiritimatiellia bacterium]
MTNEVSSVTNAQSTISFDKQKLARLSVFSRLGSFSLPLNLTTNYTIRWEWRDTRDLVAFTNFPGRILDGSNGYASVEARLIAIDEGAHYEAELWAYLNGQRGHRLAWHSVTVTNSGAGSQDLNINVSGAPVDIADLTAIGQSTGLVPVTRGDGTTDLLPYGGGGGDGGSGSFDVYSNGVLIGTATGINVNASMFHHLQSGVLEIGFVSSLFPGRIGSNRVYFLSEGTNSWQVPSGITNIGVWTWGGGGAGSTLANGGFTYVEAGATPLEFLEVMVPQGGLAVTGSTTTAAYTDNAIGGGGRGVSRTTVVGGGGGGAAWVIRSTNDILAIAGGSGGGASPGTGGGVSGGVGTGAGSSTPGGGGNQTEGGSTAATPSFVNHSGTNTVGSFLLGGNGAVTNGFAGSAHGGGGGYFGGGGSYTVNNNSPGGGGGSGHVGTNTYFGVTYRTLITDIPEYVSGRGVGAAGTHGNRAGSGLVVIGY